MLTSVLASSLRAASHAARWTNSRPAATRAVSIAKRWRIACLLHSGAPKAFRSFTCARVTSRAAWASPIARAPKTIRSFWKFRTIAANPSPSAPNRFAPGIRQALNVSSAVSEDRQQCFSRGLPIPNPGRPRSTTNMEIACFAEACRGSRAATQ